MASNLIIQVQVYPTCSELLLCRDARVLARFPASTAARGLGEEEGSFCTPRGLHRIVACIGEGSPINSVFVGRLPTGEIYTPALGAQYPERDWILTRILHLEGLESGKNQGGSVDSFRRFIYIHGTPEEGFSSVPSSHGCVRMRNRDIISVFDAVTVGVQVVICDMVSRGC